MSVVTTKNFSKVEGEQADLAPGLKPIPPIQQAQPPKEPKAPVYKNDAHKRLCQLKERFEPDSDLAREIEAIIGLISSK